MKNNDKSYKEPQMVEIRHIRKERSFTLEMVHTEAKGRSFMMGSEDGHDNEKPVHEVSFTYDFELGKYPVTIEQYMYFVHDTDSHYPEWLEEGNKYNIETGDNDYYKKLDLLNLERQTTPIVGVNWKDAVAYCKWLSEKSGQDYRLPSEAEWEYACRAGTPTKWSFGDDEEELENYAWYNKNSKGKTQPVGTREPNPWGLYDMHGNVWEWCQDSWVDSYDNTPRDGTAYKNESTSSKVLRGGSWGDDDINSRSAYRSSWDDDYIRCNYVGFRLLRTLS
ncbi:MAG: Unknown protein [uncultured Sulfurovum sp.]|uniref:Sulfatase-modifying factor enzyme-like domain-containing protein n=1 Tax=uncultured Sulfurovum sp. TaxID=269237 RepID=A0A6S6TI30_9BACT|nr:MAG: Unknown protein [uncultured Sulfurovum sp.]